MEGKTVVGWMQLAIAAFLALRAVDDRRAGRLAWRDTIVLALNSGGVGIATLTSGWVRNVAWMIAGVCASLIVARMFAWRDRGSSWMALMFGGLALPIAVVELRFDDLTLAQRALFVGLATVFATLIVVMTVRLIRNQKRVAPST